MRDYTIRCEACGKEFKSSTVLQNLVRKHLCAGCLMKKIAEESSGRNAESATPSAPAPRPPPLPSSSRAPGMPPPLKKPGTK